MEEVIIDEPRGFSGFRLKMFAMITMLCDHIGATIIERGVFVKAGEHAITTGSVTDLKYLNSLGGILFLLRDVIGRMAFPVFCFLLVEGFLHTRDWKKYALRLFAFGLISEIPFDLAFRGTWLEFSYQNVFFTLGIGLVVMAGMHYFEQKALYSRFFAYIGEAAAAATGMAAAYFLHTDYGAFGVFVIAGFYFLRRNRSSQVWFGCIAFCWELAALFAFIPIYHYDGKRGKDLKYGFYVFYPLHLLILGLLTKICF